MSKESKDIRMCIFSYTFIMVMLFLLLFFVLNSCSISFTNISTHGTANDLVDEEQKSDADIRPHLNVPAAALF